MSDTPKKVRFKETENDEEMEDQKAPATVSPETSRDSDDVSLLSYDDFDEMVDDVDEWPEELKSPFVEVQEPNFGSVAHLRDRMDLLQCHQPSEDDASTETLIDPNHLALKKCEYDEDEGPT